MAQAGPRATVMLHRAADEALAGLKPGVAMLSKTTPELQGYIELARTFEPKDAPYLQNHRGHLMFLRPEEQEFITAPVIRGLTFTGTRAELIEQLKAIKAAGYRQFGFHVRNGHEMAMLEDWAEVVAKV